MLGTIFRKMMEVIWLGDARVNAFKEKINRALEWIEIPLKIGKNAGEILSEHGGSIVSAVSGVLKLLAFV